jgi:hypothetical protein
MSRPLPRSARLGRRLGIGVFALLVSVPTAVWSIQIMQAVWAPEPGPAPSSCASGLRGLIAAVERARKAVQEASSGEREGIAAFRGALHPEWDSRGAIAVACASDARGAAMLREIDGLRYAEEHAVRYEAESLARQRRRAGSLLGELGSESEQQ